MLPFFLLTYLHHYPLLLSHLLILLLSTLYYLLSYFLSSPLPFRMFIAVAFYCGLYILIYLLIEVLILVNTFLCIEYVLAE